MHPALVSDTTSSSNDATTADGSVTGRLARPVHWLANGGAASLMLFAAFVAAVIWVPMEGVPRFNSASLSLPLQQTLWDSYSEPTVSTVVAGAPAELGVLFRPVVTGSIVGLRFYKVEGDSGPHLGMLWSAKGKQLATVTFANETDLGWQEAHFVTPVPVEENRLLVASYFTPVGGPLTGDESGQERDAPRTSGSPVFRLPPSDNRPMNMYYPGGTGFPSTDAGDSAIWVDVVFVPATAAR